MQKIKEFVKIQTSSLSLENLWIPTIIMITIIIIIIIIIMIIIIIIIIIIAFWETTKHGLEWEYGSFKLKFKFLSGKGWTEVLGELGVVSDVRKYG